MKSQLSGTGPLRGMRPRNRGRKSSRGGGKAQLMGSSQSMPENQQRRSKKSQKQRSELRRDFKAPERRQNKISSVEVNLVQSNIGQKNLELRPRKASFGFAYLYSSRSSLNPSLDYARILPGSRYQKPPQKRSKKPGNKAKTSPEPKSEKSQAGKPRKNNTIPKPGRRKVRQKDPIEKTVEVKALAKNKQEAAAVMLDNSALENELEQSSRELVSVPETKSENVPAKVDSEDSFFPEFNEDDWLENDEPHEGRLLKLEPSWRYAWLFLCLFTVLCLLAISWSHKYTFFTLTNVVELFGIEFAISFPLLILAPGLVLGKAFFRVYNKYATMSDKYLRLHTGVLTMNSKVVEMETDTMLVVQVSQSPIDKILNIGTVSVGRFSRRNLEVNIPGVRNPHRHLRVMKKRIKAARARKAKLNHQILKDFSEEFDDGMDGEG